MSEQGTDQERSEGRQAEPSDEISPLDVARAGRMFIDGREAVVNALGAEVVDDQRIRNLVTCTVCGAMGNEGDECGRRPYGHHLTTVTLRASLSGSTGGPS